MRKFGFLAFAAALSAALGASAIERHDDSYVRNGVTYAQRGGMSAETYVVTNVDMTADDVGAVKRDATWESVSNKAITAIQTLEPATNYTDAAIEASTNALRKVDGSARTLPKYLWRIDFYDTYPEDARRYYEWRGENEEGGSCSAMRDGGFVYRNFDFPLDERAEFVVRVTGGEGRFASVGVSQVGTNITESMVTSGKPLPPTFLKALPGATVDGVNENGVVAEINVVDGEPSWRSGGDIHPLGAVRWALDNGTSAAMVASNLAQRVAFPEGWGQNFHYLVADELETYVVENGTNYLVNGKAVMTNFKLYPKTYGAGWERYGILKDLGLGITDVWYTKAYSRDTSPAWVSEFKNETEMNAALGYWEELGTDEARRKTGAFWQSLHTSVYDITNRTLRVAVQETDDWYVFDLPIGGRVKSVNGKVGHVTLDADDVGAYAKVKDIVFPTGQSETGKVVTTGNLADNESDPFFVPWCWLTSPWLGNGSSASGQFAQAFGFSSLASGYGSVAVGTDPTASANYAAAFGVQPQATGLYSMAVGNTAKASGTQASAFGYNAQADGGESVALGHMAVASGYRSVAVGNTVIADDDRSVIIGTTQNGEPHVSHGTNTLNFVATDNPDRIYFNDKTMRQLVQQASPPVELPEKWALANVTNANGEAVSPTDIGAYTTQEVDELYDDNHNLITAVDAKAIEAHSLAEQANGLIDNHTTDYTNPHNVTAAQVGAVAEGDSIYVKGQTDDDFAMFGSSELSSMGITLSHKSSGSISKFNIIPNTGGGPAAFSISLADASSGVPYFPPEIFYLPAGMGGGRLALESWNSLSKSLIDATTNRTADCECISTNICKLIAPHVETVNVVAEHYDKTLEALWEVYITDGDMKMSVKTNEDTTAFMTANSVLKDKTTSQRYKVGIDGGEMKFFTNEFGNPQ